MIKDSYIEQAIKAKPGREYYIKIMIPLFVAIIGAISVMFIGVLGILIFVIGICLFMNLSAKRQLEYEYTLTNGSIDIAAIYNASKRKELMNFELEQVTMIVPKDSKRIETEQFAKKRDYTSRRGKGQVISMVVEYNGSRELVSIEPDERTLEHIRNYARNKMYDL